MVSFPNAKINLGLNILRKRADGFHDIESCFYPIGWSDTLEIIPSSEVKFTSYGIEIPGDPQSNLCLKAYELLDKDFNLDPVEIILLKNIPIGAGLGGGSADAAYCLKMINEYFSLQLKATQLESYAEKLGSDCPFFINNYPVIATETGTTFSQTSLNLSGKQISVVYPNLHISTGEAYSKVVPKESSKSISDIINLPIEDWKSILKNDFESGLSEKYQVISEIKETMYSAGALYSSLTGSGSAIYGIFAKESGLPSFPDYKQWNGVLS